MVPPNRRNSLFLRKGSIHCGPMKEVELEEEYDILKRLGTGRFGNVHLAEHKDSKIKIALKIFPKINVKQGDFIREYNFSYFLSPHPNIIDTYEGTFVANESFFFVQEYCSQGSLREAIDSNGTLAEAAIKSVLTQVLAALEFMHNEHLVHRNLKAENILIFDTKNLEKVKITDFGLTRKQMTTVKHTDTTNVYHAPELCETLLKEAYVVDASVDIWALGVISYYAMRGKFPWSKATIMCKPFWEWEEWLKRTAPQLPPRWGRFTEKGLKWFKKTLNPKPKDRSNVKDLKKCLKDKWTKEIKSMSEEDLFAADNPNERTQSANLASTSIKEGNAHTHNRGKRRSVLHQWFASTLSAMSEISEQMVSATE